MTVSTHGSSLRFHGEQKENTENGVRGELLTTDWTDETDLFEWDRPQRWWNAHVKPKRVGTWGTGHNKGIG